MLLYWLACSLPTLSGPPPVLDLGGGMVYRFAYVPGGPVTLKGNDGAVTVRVPPLWVGTTEVSNAVAARLLPSRGDTPPIKPGYAGIDFDGPSHPAVLSWMDATALAEQAAAHSGLPVRLPSEAEWQHVADLGTPWTFGDDLSALRAHGNSLDDASLDEHAQRVPGEDWSTNPVTGDDGHRHTAPIASYLPDARGIYDLHGNLSEWVADAWAAEIGPRHSAAPRPAPEGQQRDPNLSRVHRGGAWNTPADLTHAGARNFCWASAHFNSIGARLVLPAQ